MRPEEHPLIRGLRVFGEDSLGPKMAELRATFGAEWHRFGERAGELFILTCALWETEDPALSATLLPRIAWLLDEKREAWGAMTDAVDLGSALRMTRLFAPEGLTPRSTLAAISSARMSEEPLQGRG